MFNTSRISLSVALGLILLTGCSSQTETAPLELPSEIVSTDIQGRLTSATGIEWEDGRMGDSSPYGFIQRLIPVDPEECDIDVFIFRTDAQAQSASKEVTSWGWTSIWQVEDPSTQYGVFIGERSENQPCTDDAASVFEATLSR